MQLLLGKHKVLLLLLVGRCGASALHDDVVVWILWLKARIQVGIGFVHTVETTFDDAGMLQGTSWSIALESLIDTTFLADILLPCQQTNSSQVLRRVWLVDWCDQRWLNEGSSWILRQISCVLHVIHIH